MTVHVIWRVLNLKDMSPISGAELSAKSPNGDWSGQFTNAQGLCPTDLTPGHYDVTFKAPGFTTETIPAEIENPGTITHGLVALTGMLAYSGRDITVGGKVTKIIGIDGFLDYRYFLDHKDLTPYFDEARELGFNARRVWFEGAIEDNTVMQLDPRAPGFYDSVRKYIDVANQAGFIILADIGVNNQYFNMGYDHWDKMNNLWRGSNTISSGGNEASKNGFDRLKVPNAQMPLWSSGSEQQNGLPEVSTGATVMLFHGVRNWPTSIRDAVASPTEIYDVKHFPDVPLLFDEMVKMGDQGSERCNEPRVCYRFGRHWSAESAGAFYHNWRAQRGLLLNDLDKRCAEGFVRGMMS